MYSQYDEERYILEACKGVSHGTVLDIGACHPTQFSNSRALVELGWQGVMIEPSPRLVGDLLAEYGNNSSIHVVAAAVGMEDTLAVLHINEGMLSTVSESFKARYAGEKWLGKMWVQQMSLPTISNIFGGFDFVSIDTEGTSADICLKMLDLGWGPTCFVVEHDSRILEISNKATAVGYRMVYSNGTNGVFAR